MPDLRADRGRPDKPSSHGVRQSPDPGPKTRSYRPRHSRASTFMPAKPASPCVKAPRTPVPISTRRAFHKMDTNRKTIPRGASVAPSRNSPSHASWSAYQAAAPGSFGKVSVGCRWSGILDPETGDEPPRPPHRGISLEGIHVNRCLPAFDLRMAWGRSPLDSSLQPGVRKA